MTEVYTVYWGPGGRLVGAFPTSAAANAFIICLLRLDPGCGPREEFSIDALPYQPDPTEIELP